MRSKILHVIGREYKAIVRTKAFIISTLLMPLFMGAIFFIPFFSAASEQDTQRSIGIIDESGVMFESLKKELADTLSAGRPAYLIERIYPEEKEAVPGAVTGRIQQGELDLVLRIHGDALESGQASMYSRVVSNFQLNRRIYNAMKSVITNLRLSREGFEPALINKLMSGISVETIRVGKGGMEKEQGQTFLLTFFMVFVIYMTVLMYGTSVMRSVIEEKSTRVIEILISSLKPFQIMFGKLIGVSLVGITQYTIWAVFGLLLFTYGNILLGFFPSLPQIPVQTSIPGILFFYFILFFLLGYLQYAALYACLGAIVTSEQEAQQMAIPVILPLIIPIIMFTYIQSNPDSMLTVSMSLIPLFSPLIMMARISLAEPPLWQIFTSIGVLLVSVVLVTYVAGRIYRIGILMYGKKPALSEVIKWIGRS